MEIAIIRAIYVACFFLLLVSALDHYFKKSVWPPICWILLAGVLYGVAARFPMGARLPRVMLEPDVVIYLFLPILIFDSSRKLKLKELCATGVVFSLYATLGLVLSMFLIALPFSWMTGVPLWDCLLFGAILSATDPIAVSAIFQNFKFPEKLRTMIEGESLVNDGTTLILFTLLSMKVLKHMSISLEWGLVDFGWAIAGALLAGCALGYVGHLLLCVWKELHNRFIGALLPVIAMYLTFVLAQHALQVSGVIAVMAASLTMTNLHRDDQVNHAQTYAFFDQFWDFLGDLANAALFFILGVEIGRHEEFAQWLWAPGSIAILLFSRSVVVYAGAGVMKLARQPIPLSWQHVINLAGLRGALSVALILLMPATYAHRRLFLCAAFFMILFTIFVNTLAMQKYLKKAKL